MGQRHVCTFRHAQRAAYRTAISAAQILVINVLIKVTLDEIRCRDTLQSQWSKLTDSTSLKAEKSVNVTDESRSSWYSSWNGTGGSSDDGGRWRQTYRTDPYCVQTTKLPYKYNSTVQGRAGHCRTGPDSTVAYRTGEVRSG